MSADNFVGVRPQKVNGQLTGNYEIFEYGCMSILDEDCMYLADATPTFLVSQTSGIGSGAINARAIALVQAHDIVNRIDICEYGVIELSPVPDKPCGRCYVCVHERRIVSDDLTRCDHCGNPIAQGEWTTMTNGGIYHSSCERELSAH